MDKQDYISREEARSTLSTVTNDVTCPLSIASQIEFMLDMVPAVDVAPVKHGHWIEEYDCGYITPHCSECGETALTKEETSYDYVYSSYCPRCGAKMDGGEQN